MACVESASANLYDEQPIFVAGGVEDLGRTGDHPDVLYHITDRAKLKSIVRDGLIPMQGKNNYKNYEDKVFLADKRNVAVWLTILEYVDDPVILKVKTKGLSVDIGRVFWDRNFVDDKYYEYETREPIPPSAIQETDLHQSGFDILLCDELSDFLTHTRSLADIQEVYKGFERIAVMGLTTNDAFDKAVEDRAYHLHQDGKLSDNSLDIVLSYLMGKELTDAIRQIEISYPGAEI